MTSGQQFSAIFPFSDTRSSHARNDTKMLFASFIFILQERNVMIKVNDEVNCQEASLEKFFKINKFFKNLK
jgi:hypothetical protein